MQLVPLQFNYDIYLILLTHFLELWYKLTGYNRNNERLRNNNESTQYLK